MFVPATQRASKLSLSVSYLLTSADGRCSPDGALHPLRLSPPPSPVLVALFECGRPRPPLLRHLPPPQTSSTPLSESPFMVRGEWSQPAETGFRTCCSWHCA